MSLGMIANEILYALSGFFFGTFFCRLGVFAYRYLYSGLSKANFLVRIISGVFYGCLVAAMWLLAPIIFYRYTATGGFVMLITIMYYANYARRIGSLTRAPGSNKPVKPLIRSKDKN